MTPITKPCIFGEVLFDCFPDGQQVLGGAPFNVAWHLQQFGLQPQFISRIGNDEQGQRIQQAMQSSGMSSAQLQIDPELPSGKVSIEFAQGEPQYDIVHPSAWDAISAIDGDYQCDFLYHGSLSLRDPRSRDSFQALRQRCQGQIFVDINLRPPWWDRALIGDLLLAADWAKLNEDELCTLQGSTTADLSLMRQYALQGLIVTRGSSGAELLTVEGTSLQVTPAPGSTVVDTVGAGDAFTSVILFGLLSGWPMEYLLPRAQAFASQIVGIRGAIPSDTAIYQNLIASWQ